MPKYRKLPVEIDAIAASEVLDAYERGYADELPLWVTSAVESGDLRIERRAADPEKTYLHVTTLEGIHFVSELDMLIRGVKGELYGCDPEVFDVTYEMI